MCVRVCVCVCAADHFLDVITPRVFEKVEDLEAREKKLHESYSSKALTVDLNEGETHTHTHMHTRRAALHPALPALVCCLPVC